jgi:ammonium transporter, Amt family
MPIAPPVLSEAAVAVCFFCILIAPCALGGVALINAGLGRSRSVAHTLLTSLSVLSVAALAYFVLGAALQSYPGQPAWRVIVRGEAWNWLGAEPWFLRGAYVPAPHALAVVLGLLAACFTALIPLGAAAERWRLAAACASTLLLSALLYPLLAHWSWGGGWLAQLGTNCGMGSGLLDSGGSGTIHALGGLTGLALVWILGPRRGKFPPQGLPAAFPAHNAPLVLLGCFLAWFGFIGLDCAGAILFTGVPAFEIMPVPVNATLAAAAALLTAVVITRVRFVKVDASLCANAWVAGLVSSAAGCALMPPLAAVFTGLVAGALVVFGVEWIELYFQVDDPGGVIPVHAMGGLWGLLAAGMFARNTPPDQWLAQLVGVATLIGFFLPAVYGLNRLLNRFLPQRVDPEGERHGLDLQELGAGAYPDFMSYNDEY